MVAIGQKEMVGDIGKFISPILAVLGAIMAIAIAVPAAMFTVG